MFIVNVTNKEIVLESEFVGKDLLSQKEINKNIKLKPYDYLWIKIS